MKTLLTPIEENFWKASQDLIQGIQPQAWIDNYRVDFLIKSKNLVIELDGHDYHKTKEQRTKDASRQRCLEMKGYRVIRFTGTEIHKNVNKCVQETIGFMQTLKTNEIKTYRETGNIAYCQRMQDVITHLCIANGFYPTSEFDFDLTLEMGEYWDPLTIVKSGKMINLWHSCLINGDIFYDPKVVFKIISNPVDGLDEWVPISITQFPINGYATYSICVDPHNAYRDDQTIEITDYEAHFDIANFVYAWSRTLISNGWIDSSSIKKG